MVIARIWKGAVRREDGDEYAKYMEETGIARGAGEGRVLSGG